MGNLPRTSLLEPPTARDAALERAVAAFAPAWDRMPVGVCVFDSVGAVQYFNRSAAELCGYSPAPDASRMREVEHALARHLGVASTPDAARGEAGFLERPDGSRVALSIRADALRGESGEILGAVACFDGVRAQSSLLRRAHEQSALYRFTDRLYRASSAQDIYDAALDAIAGALSCRRASILLFDDDGVMRFVAWRGLSDAYRAAVEGHSPWRPGERDPHPIWIADIEASDESEALKSVVRAEGIRALTFVPLVANGGTIGKFMTYYEAPRTPDQDDLDLAVTIARQLGFGLERLRNEVARRAAQAALTKSEAELRTLADNIHQLVWMADAAGEVYWYNRRWLDYTGRTGEDMRASDWRDAHHPEHYARVMDKLRHCLDAGEPWEDTFPLRGREGDYRWFLSRALPVRDDAGRVTRWFGTGTDITDRLRADEQRTLLINELNHRVRNTLATVQAIAAQTFADHRADTAARIAFEERLLALANAHGVLTRENWEGAGIREVIASALGPHSCGGRLNVSGPELRLSPKAAVAIVMGLHELATNATKYGALSTADGRVDVTWNVEAKDIPMLLLEWKESGGPPVRPPERRGFGSRLIERNLAHDLAGEAAIEFRPEGVVCRIRGRISAPRSAPFIRAAS